LITSMRTSALPFPRDFLDLSFSSINEAFQESE
jgi:hypothetical protein